MRLFLALLAAGCGAGAAGPDAAVGRWCETTLEWELEVPQAYDFLFVIDRAPSMAEEQAVLVDNYRRMMRLLQNTAGALDAIHIGVISSDPADHGALQSSPHGDCQSPAGAFIAEYLNPDGSRTRNFGDTLEDTFACIAALGAGGGEIRAPLAAARRALDGSSPQNAGFLRLDAFLVAVFLTDGDDCSADPEPTDPFACVTGGVTCDGRPVGREPAAYQACQPRASGAIDHPAEYVEFFRSLKTDPSLIILTAITGPPAPFEIGAGPAVLPSCSGPGGVAAPAVRLGWLLDQFPGRSAHTTICDDDLTDVFAVLSRLDPPAPSTATNSPTSPS